MNILHNTSVKTDRPDLLVAFFPDYMPVQELPPYPVTDRVLFLGKLLPQTTARLTREYVSYITTAQVSKVQLVQPIEWLRLVFDKWGKTPTKKLEELCESMDMDSLEPYLKIAWITGKFPLSIKDDDVSVYELFKAIPGPQNDLISTYLKVVGSLPFNVVESSVLTFLSRVSAVDEQEVSVQYKKLLLQCSVKIGANIKPSVRKYANDTRTKRELALLELLLSLRGR